MNSLTTSETNKNKFTFFEIKDFYLTITKDLVTKCLKFAEEKVQISDDDENHARKSLLFNEGGTWMKKSHTCEEGGAHLRISFWHLLMHLKNK